MNESDFLRIVQSRTARIAVGASTVRGRGNSGTVASARAYLRTIDLAAFGTGDSARFTRALDEQTERLRLALPLGSQHWGVARKVLNIFLRDSFYTTYLCAGFDLEKAESLFEIPLDSITATRLKHETRSRSLPPWNGVKNVTSRINSEYQRAANEAAATNHVSRVHLDALWWSVSRD